MIKAIPKSALRWLPTVAVLIVVLVAGGRLIALSVSERAEHLREAAQVTVNRAARLLETQLARPAPRSATNPANRNADRLAASPALKRLAASGFNFEVAEVDPGNRFRQVLLRSQTPPLNKPVTSRVRSPADFLAQTPGGHLELSISPKAGWYPTRQLATSIGLLSIVAWLFAFGVHDLTHSLDRAKSTVAALRIRVRRLNDRLTGEIDARQQLQQSFEHARYHDAFTGLPNRRFFMDRLDRALRDVRARRRQKLAIVLIGIERFRLINDTLGHTAGDELMVQAARRFAQATENLECTFARWGEDQFAALVLDVASSAAAFSIANAMQEALQAPFDLRRHRLNVTARMGVTFVESGTQRPEEALREADIALSVSRRQEALRTVAYVPAMGGDAASLVSLEADLHTALERNEFHLLYQPIVDLRRERVVGAEALLRWHHPVEGTLAPARFLAIAEEAGLLEPLTRWVILSVCRMAGTWRHELPAGTPFYISINIPATVLRDPGFVDYVALALSDTRTPAQAIKFELTEGGLIANVGAAREVLQRLHEMGIELMLDDFGTGYSSLSYLQLFPFDYLKIDRPLVNRAGSEQANSGITQAVLQMASSLSLKTIAEVVETPEVAHALTEMGCDYGQGFYFSHPMEAGEAFERMRTQNVHAGAPTLRSPDDTLWETEDESPTLVMAPLEESTPPAVKKRAR